MALMKAKSNLGLLLITVLAVLAITTFAQTRSSKRQTWEYKSISSVTTGFEGDKTFNEFGRLGWELVAASGERDTGGVTYVFKRAK